VARAEAGAELKQLHMRSRSKHHGSNGNCEVGILEAIYGLGDSYCGLFVVEERHAVGTKSGDRTVHLAKYY
jgi:hypothetical protein